MKLLIIDSGALDADGNPAHLIEVFGIPLVARAALTGLRAGAESVVLETDATGESLENIKALLNGYSKLEGKVEIKPNGSTETESNGYVTVNSNEFFDDGLLSGEDGSRAEVLSRSDALEQERKLLARIRGEKRSMDGIVDVYFNRRISTRLSKQFVKTPLTPNIITVFNIIAGLTAAALFATTGYISGIAASLFFQISTILDCSDGEVARLKFMESKLGRTMDSFGDYAVHVAIFFALGFRFYTLEGNTLYLWLGASASIGSALAAVFLYKFKYAYMDKYPERSGQKIEKGFNKVIDVMATRDFSVLIIIFAVIAKLKLMLWMLALGSHSFWLVLAYFQARLWLRNRNSTEAH